MNKTNLDQPIEEPKVSFVDKVKYKLGYFQGRSRVVTTVVGIFLMAGISVYIAYASLSRRNVSLNNPESNIGAANPSCLLTLSLKKPTPSPTPTTPPTPKPSLQCGATCPNQGNTCASGMSCINGVCRNPSCSTSANCICKTPSPVPTVKPSASPISSVCKVVFDLPDTAICWKEPRVAPITYKIISLPSSGGPFYLQTDWYVASPFFGGNHYQEIGPITAGQTGTVYADWPGIPTGEYRTVEIHAGLNVLDSKKQIVSPNCSDGMDYYWTPYVNCPNISPTPKPTSCPIYKKMFGYCK